MKQTCVVTDWSTKGIGFLVFQKRCTCMTCDPFTCADGRQLVFCGSRQLTAAERNYAPVEGEALIVSWCLKRAKMFLLGCQKFTIFMDHKLLISIFSDSSLEHIDNPRLFHLEEKTPQFTFDIKLLSWKKNSAADTSSRYLVSRPDSDDENFACDVEMSTVMLSVASISKNEFVYHN